MTELEQLGHFVKHLRTTKKESQQKFADRLGLNRSVVAHLEQAERVPKPEVLTSICNDLQIPEVFWTSLTNDDNNNRIIFETILSELVGKNVSLDLLSSIEHEEAKKHISQLFENTGKEEQVFDNFNRCLIFYGVKKITTPFFKHYLYDKKAFTNLEQFHLAIQEYQKDAIRVFSTFSLAYEELNKDQQSFEDFLQQLRTKDLSSYKDRNKWESITNIQDEHLAHLGYIAAENVAKEERERQRLIDFLKEIVKKLETGKVSQHTLEKEYGKKTLNKMDGLLRKFDSKIEHGFLSGLFNVDIGLLELEIERLAPKGEADLILMKETQDIAFANLTNYLTADYMDLYIATSMRNDGDFISVNDFVNSLMEHPDIKELNLRYFNPTQSWIEDRIAKGLIEALMLKRASITIYMAQKSDTFGKDSEASVALGQGKPVIVYVPKLTIPEIKFDSSILSKMSESELLDQLDEDTDEYEGYDSQALLSAVIKKKLDTATDEAIMSAVETCWAEFDLESEAIRIDNDSEKKEFRTLIKSLKGKSELSVSKALLKNLRDILLPVTVNYEKRANIFMEIHPLALQVILSTGVLNGILVARSLNSCAKLLRNLLENKMDLELKSDGNNYKLIETSTGSVIRVISKNVLLSHSFEQFYQYGEAE
jgi:transcriptional regulator with XRE-family HTH domain